MIRFNNSSAIILFLVVVLTFNISFVFAQIGGELNSNCKAEPDCRIDAYVCTDSKCNCAATYHPNPANDMCIGGVGKSCLVDSNCEEGLLCHSDKCVKQESEKEATKSCQGDTECDAGQTCTNSECIKKGVDPAPTNNNQSDKDLHKTCQTSNECPKDAYVCTDNKCVCVKHYQPNKANTTCVGAIGEKCEKDAHCVAEGMCTDKICTCKEGKPAEDKWSCKNAAGFTKPLLLTLLSSLLILLVSK